MTPLPSQQTAAVPGPPGARRWARTALPVLCAVLAAVVALPGCGVMGRVGDSVAVIGAEPLQAAGGTRPAAVAAEQSAADPSPAGSAVTGAATALATTGTPTAPALTGATTVTAVVRLPGAVPAVPVESPSTTASTAAPTTVTTIPVGVSPTPPAAAPCTVGEPPRTLGLDPFYRKACVVDGLAVVASVEVDDAALVAAAVIVQGMLAPRPDLAEQMARRRFRLGVIGVTQRAVELPEYRDLPTNYPRTDWSAARAYGATPRRPLAAAPEENLLCLAEDTYPDQSVLVHELGHSVLDMAVAPADPAFKARIEAAFRAASTLDVYRNTYAMTNADEYWAEGVQDFFDASRAAYGPGGGGDGYDGPIASRETLRRDDPTLYGLIAEVFTESSWRPSCPAGR